MPISNILEFSSAIADTSKNQTQQRDLFPSLVTLVKEKLEAESDKKQRIHSSVIITGTSGVGKTFLVSILRMLGQRVIVASQLPQPCPDWVHSTLSY
jgi:DNA replication protein DnaC